MIGKEDLDNALDLIARYNENGPPWHENMEREGLDPVAVIECASEHADALAEAGIIRDKQELINSTISFGAGFTLAIVLMSLEKEKNV